MNITEIHKQKVSILYIAHKLLSREGTIITIFFFFFFGRRQHWRLATIYSHLLIIFFQAGLL